VSIASATTETKKPGLHAFFYINYADMEAQGTALFEWSQSSNVPASIFMFPKYYNSKIKDWSR
jgi:hypothetical protein